MERKMLLLIIVVVFALIIFNIYIFAKPNYKVACYKDACFYAQTEPVQEFKNLVLSSDKIILLAEGDSEPTQRTSFIDLALVQLAADFNQFDLMIVGIGYSEGVPVVCFCEETTEWGNFTQCAGSSVEYCQNIKPDENSMMISLKYPTYQKNEVYIEGRTVRVQAKSGAEVLAIAYVLRDLK